MRERDSRRRFTPRQARQLLLAADGKCQRCGVDLTHRPFHIHHVRRYADGGPTQLYNAMVLCFRCHQEVS